MSVRLEWTTAEYAAPKVYRRGAELEDGNVVDEADFALVIGTQVVQGSAIELARLLTRALDQVVKKLA